MLFWEKELARKVQKLVPDVPIESIAQIILYRKYKKTLSTNKKEQLKKLEWKYNNLRK